MPKPKRNVVSTYSESKVKVGVSLTPTGANRLTAIAEKLGLSKSELFERIASGDLLKSSELVKLTFSLQNGSNAQKQIAAFEGEETKGEIGDGATSAAHHQELPAKQNELLESYEALQKQSQEQIAAIASLQVQLAQLQEQQTVPQESYEALQKQSQEQIDAIASLQIQLAQLQHLQNELLDSVSRTSYEALHRQSQEQAETIKTLQEQITQMRTMAGIGEAKLNKWRNRTFSR